jgi:hypothetical protein
VTEGRLERDGAAGRAAIGQMRAVEAQQERLRKAAAAAAKASRGGGGGGGKGGGGGGGASKEQKAQEAAAKKALKDAERDNTQRLKLDRDYQLKSEDAARDHVDKLAEIEQDAAEKRKQAADQYAQGRLDGEADFYDQLGTLGTSDGGGDKKKAKADQALAREANAKYQAALQKADKLANEGKADQADAYRQASEQAIQQETATQKKINDLKADGNDSAAEYYQGVLAKQQAANQRELDQIVNQGSAIQREVESRYAAEEARYAKHLDELARIRQQKIDELGFDPTAGTAPATDPASTGSGADSGVVDRSGPPPPGVTIPSASPAAAGATPGQGQLMTVSAPDVVAAIGSQTTSLSERLSAVESAVTDQGKQIVAGLRQVASAARERYNR